MQVDLRLKLCSLFRNKNNEFFFLIIMERNFPCSFCGAGAVISLIRFIACTAEIKGDGRFYKYATLTGFRLIRI